MTALRRVTGEPVDLSLYLVTDFPLATAQGRTDLAIVKAAVAGGVTTVQFRDKQREGRELYRVGRELRDFCADAGITFIVNDRLDLALALEADGLHLGQSDLPIEVARQVAGDRLFIGLSVVTEQETYAALLAQADYLGASPVFTSSTKPDAGEGIGLKRLANLVQLAGTVPVVGIGAINATNAAEVIRSGASGVAVVSAIVGAADVTSAAQQLRQLIDACKLTQQLD
jgi:thiamine-phosphate diphosphorylase